MNTNSDLNYHLYIQREIDFRRTPFKVEFERYKDISSGNVENVKKMVAERKKNFFQGKGLLSEDPLRNARYHVIISTAVTSRVCVRDGMDIDTAYALSDIYILRADAATTVKELIDIQGEMQIDYAERMKDLQKVNAVSLHIRKCIDYIYSNLHEKITNEILANYLGIDKTYLSKLFLKETGCNVKEFTTNARISTAKNMLIYSDYSYMDIALSLGFSSQSAFNSVFRKATGMTPGQFRQAAAIGPEGV